MNNSVIKKSNVNIYKHRPDRKTVLLCTNGFQTTDTHDSLPMQEYFNKEFKKEFSNCEISLVRLFSPAKRETHKKKYFEKQLEEAIKEFVEKDYDIYLMGYSFSAALVAKMAHKYAKNVTRVIFVAPVYDTLVNNMIPGYIKYAYKFHKLNKKYGKKVASGISRQTVVGLPGLLIAIFNSILSNRKYFKKVNQPTLLIRGLDDILCTEHSLKKVEKKIAAHSETYLYPNMTHGILKTVKLNGIVYEDILSFCFDTPLLIEKNVEYSSNSTEEKNVDTSGEVIPTFAEIFSEIDPDGDSLIARQENEF